MHQESGGPPGIGRVAQVDGRQLEVRGSHRSNGTVARVTLTDQPVVGEHLLGRRALTRLLVATAGYVACSILANVMSARILRIGPDWASFSIDAGTLTYPLTFTLRDLVHKVGGLPTRRPGGDPGHRRAQRGGGTCVLGDVIAAGGPRRGRSATELVRPL